MGAGCCFYRHLPSCSPFSHSLSGLGDVPVDQRHAGWGIPRALLRDHQHHPSLGYTLGCRQGCGTQGSCGPCLREGQAESLGLPGSWAGKESHLVVSRNPSRAVSSNTTLVGCSTHSSKGMVCLTRGVGRRARVCAMAGGARHVPTLAGRRALELDHSESQEEIQNLAILPGMWAHKVWSQQALKKVPRIRQHSLSPQDTLSQAQSMEQCKAELQEQMGQWNKPEKEQQERKQKLLQWARRMRMEQAKRAEGTEHGKASAPCCYLTPASGEPHKFLASPRLLLTFPSPPCSLCPSVLV